MLLTIKLTEFTEMNENQMQIQNEQQNMHVSGTYILKL